MRFSLEERLLAWYHWKPHIYARSLSRYALNHEHSPHFLDSFLHRVQPQVSWERTCRLKTSPIVAYLEANLMILFCKPHCNYAGAGMFDDVVERLLGDAVERVFPLQGESGFFP